MGEFARPYAGSGRVHVVEASVPGSYTGDDRFAIAHNFADFIGRTGRETPRAVWVQEIVADPYVNQTVAITGTPTGGDFTLSLGDEETAAIAYNAAAAAVVAALEALPSIGEGGVTATGGALPGTPVVLTFVNPAHPVLLTADDAGLTGGDNPAVAVTSATIDITHNAIGVIDWDDTYVYLRSNATSGNFRIYCE